MFIMNLDQPERDLSLEKVNASNGYYRLSCQRLYITNLVVKKDLRKKARNGPFLLCFPGLLPVKFQKNKLKK